MMVAAIDTETTGFLYPLNVPIRRQPKIIEVCICLFDDEDKIQNENQYFTSLFNPGFTINKTIQEITSIKPNELIKAPKFEDSFGPILKRIEASERIIAHNLYFDKTMLDIEMKRRTKDIIWPDDLFCTSDNSEHFKGKRLKMAELYMHLTEKEFPTKIHRAREDVDLLIESYMVMKEMGLAERKYNE